MTLAIERKGFLGIGLQTGFQVPATITDYIEYTGNTLHGMVDSMDVTSATSNRDSILSTISGKQWSEGQVDTYVDPKNAGYFVVAALGTVQTTNLAGSVYRHTITRNNSNTPQYLTLTSDRVIDREIYPDITVDELDLAVGVDIATFSAKLKGNFPQTTTSGTKTTTSGTLFNFTGAQFAFGTTISGAQAATPLQPHDFKMAIKNNAEAVFAHSSATPRSISVHQFTCDVDFNLYFENTTDRNTYYNQTKQSASFEMLGNGIGSGFQESMIFNFYKTSVQSFAVDTGLDNYFAEKAKLTCEFDTTTGRTVDCTITNTKSLYI